MLQSSRIPSLIMLIITVHGARCESSLTCDEELQKPTNLWPYAAPKNPTALMIEMKLESWQICKEGRGLKLRWWR